MEDVRLEENHGAVVGVAGGVGWVRPTGREGGGRLGHAGRDDMCWSSRWAILYEQRSGWARA
jgi:hypothetical protein